MIALSWNREILLFVVAVGWSALGFLSYYFLSKNKSVRKTIWKGNPGLDVQAKEVVIQRFWGFILLGVFPAIFILLSQETRLSDFGMGSSWLSPPPWWVAGLLVFIVIAAYYSSKNKQNREMYPQIRSKKWTPGLLVLSGLTWVLFLLGYEFLFRGFLFYASLKLLDVWPAIALNCALYAFAHLYKGPGETFGAIPLGILLCYLTLITGNIWTAVGIHSVMALSNEWWSLKANEHMVFSISGKN